MSQMPTLKEIVENLRLRWHWSVVAAIAALLVVLLVTLLLPPVYRATARLVVFRSGSDIQLDERFRSYPEEAWLAQSGFDLLARQRTLLELCLAPEVEARVVDRLGENLESALRVPGQLSRQVQAEANPGELIRIVAKAARPTQAALLANVWAEECSGYANEMFSSQTPSASDIAGQVEGANTTYLKAESELAAFLGRSRVDELSTALAELRGTLSRYRTLAEAADEAISRAYMLRDLHAQSEVDSAQACAVSEALKLLLLQSGALGDTDFVPFFNSLSGTDTAEHCSQLLDPESVIGVLEDWRANIALRLEDQTTYDKMRELEKQLETEKAEEQELTAARDLALDTWQLLRKKSAEVVLTADNPGSTVVFASSAIAPDRPSWPNKPMLALAAVMAGAAAGTALATLLPRKKGPPNA